MTFIEYLYFVFCVIWSNDGYCTKFITSFLLRYLCELSKYFDNHPMQITIIMILECS